jgi:hypothetical protein
MADERRTPSRRERREAAERASATSGVADSGAPPSQDPAVPGGSGAPPRQDPAIQSGFAFTSEMPIQSGGIDISAAFAEVEQAGEGPSAGERASEGSPAGDGPSGGGPVSRRDRRKQERLERPMETWTAEEEQAHTGQMPAMSPEVIAAEEAASRQVAQSAQAAARASTGEIPTASGTTLAGAAGATNRATPIVGTPDGSVPAALQHLFPPGTLHAGQAPAGAPPQAPAGAPPQAPPKPPRPPAPAGPSIDSHGRLVSPDQSAPMVVPGFADGGQPGVGAPPAGPQGPPPNHPLGAQTAAFEALVVGGDPHNRTVSAQPSTAPTAQIPQGAPGPYAPPGSGPGPVAPGGAAPMPATPGMPGAGYPAVPGQGLVVPGTGTLRTTGGMRPVPGTGAIPRPMIEVQPAGGVRHFGWVQLLLLAAAAFALGVVVWNVAGHGG